MSCSCDAQKKLEELERVIREAAKYVPPDNDAQRAPESPRRKNGRARVLAWLTSQREVADAFEKATAAMGVQQHDNHMMFDAVLKKCSDDELLMFINKFTIAMVDAGLISSRTGIASVPKGETT